ncbi:hypothetical protein BDY19DRAFT_964936 [Irpex rosettiformis]|uniref:Uncharacterized protein n=1 Tax=Irpex rosettiformis TaxID=378272 RepID=A0ACB8TUM6_9APHY|nr:hypothetical protein BDY19DRAFT_964936 [Irpex rosettiformis]
MHAPASSPPIHGLYTRNNGDGKGGLSTSSIIAIAVVCGCVGILVFTLFLWRLLLRCCRPKKSAPLPPIQDLAHRRQQQSAAFTASRQTQWLEPSMTALDTTGSFKSGSSISLLRSTEKNASGYIDDATTAESSAHSPVTLDQESPLQPPNPMFYPPITANSSPHASMISAASSDNELSRTLASPSPIQQPSEAHSTSQISLESGSTSRAAVRPRNSTPRMKQSSRGRPLSQVSAGTSYSGHTMRSASVGRGAPHKPFSGVQIVLPAPLAPEAANVQRRASSYGLSSRSSTFVDQWIAVGSSSTTTGDTGRSRKSSSASRHSQRSSSTPPTQRDPRQALGSATPPIPSRPPSAADQTRSGASTPPSSFTNRHQTRSASSLRHQVGPGQPSHPPYPLNQSTPPMRTYNSLADLAQSSFEINQFMRDRGRSHVGITSSQLTPSSSIHSSPSTQQTASPESRSRSQSRHRDPVR